MVAISSGAGRALRIRSAAAAGGRDAKGGYEVIGGYFASATAPRAGDRYVGRVIRKYRRDGHSALSSTAGARLPIERGLLRFLRRRGLLWRVSVSVSSEERRGWGGRQCCVMRHNPRRFSARAYQVAEVADFPARVVGRVGVRGWMDA